jgi:hypothetical protein
MNCISLLLGARNTPAAMRRFSASDDAKILAITARHFPAGFTVLHASGGWYDPERHTFVNEESRQIILGGVSPRALKAWTTELGRALRQDELLILRMGTVEKIRIKGPEPKRAAPRSKRVGTAQASRD